MTRVTSVSHTLAMAYVPGVFDTPSAVCWLAHWDLLTPTTFVISVGCGGKSIATIEGKSAG